MIKRMEKADGRSCWNRAENDEMVFVLLGRDIAAPHAIRQWVKERIRLGKNQADDHQMIEALNAADSIEGSQKGEKQCAHDRLNEARIREVK